MKNLDKIAFNHIFPVLIVLPVLAWLIWLTVNRAISPLQTVVAHVDKQNYAQLEKVNKADLPYEVKTLTQAINHLFQRLNQSYQREKRFTADVAHELRNPLAALSIHSDNAIAENHGQQLGEVLNNMRRGVMRLSHLVAQLLALSRADRDIQRHEFSPIDLIKMCRQLHHQYMQQADRKEQHLSIDGNAESLEVFGIEILLNSLVANLIDNAIRYSPEQSRIKIALHNQAKQIHVCVEDSGPGISDALKERVQERFYRIPGTQQMGSGLGLSIVQRIAEVHQAQVLLADSEYGGLKVEIIFPRSE